MQKTYVQPTLNLTWLCADVITASTLAQYEDGGTWNSAWDNQ